MDMSDTKARTRYQAQLPAEAADAECWRGLVGEIGAEIGGPLTSALERITALMASGRIDRHGLRALREEVEKARRVGIDSQRLARLASGQLRQQHESARLDDMLSDVLSQRARDIEARAISVRFTPAAPAEVFVDAPLLFSLLDTLLDWSLDCARSTIEMRIDVKAWPAQARLVCRFAHRPVDQLDDGAATPGEVSLLDSMHWRLLQQTARAMGLTLERAVDAGGTALTIEFAHIVNEVVQGLSAIEIGDAFATSINTRPLAGHHVLVVARRREVRVEVREALRDLGLIVDFAASVEEADAFCRDGLPHAIIVESVLCGDRFGEFRLDIAAQAPQFVFIEIIEDSRAFEMSGLGQPCMARVGRDVVAQSLPSALLFELSRGT